MKFVYIATVSLVAVFSFKWQFSSTELAVDKESKEFFGFLSQYGKSYATNQEFKMRFQVFKANS